MSYSKFFSQSHREPQQKDERAVGCRPLVFLSTVEAFVATFDSQNYTMSQKCKNTLKGTFLKKIKLSHTTARVSFC